MSSDDAPQYYDAHLHLQDERLSGAIGDLAEVYKREKVARIVVNGTRPDDWPAVLQLARGYPFVIPSFGLHPWHVNKAPENWRDALRKHLAEAAKLGKPSGIGECGLDKWVRGYDLEKQKEVFRFHLELAAEKNLPLSIHCLKAWGSLLSILQEMPKPERGFLLHSYGGPADMVDVFVELGAYFSFSGYFAREDKRAKLEAFRKVPLERLLIETDAPDMSPPLGSVDYALSSNVRGDPINHPGNIRSVYRLASKSLELDEAELTCQMALNFQCFFLGPV